MLADSPTTMEELLHAHNELVKRVDSISDRVLTLERLWQGDASIGFPGMRVVFEQIGADLRDLKDDKARGRWFMTGLAAGVSVVGGGVGALVVKIVAGVSGVAP